jgi:hypothetical protein
MSGPSVNFALQRLAQYGVEFVPEERGWTNLPENGPATVELTGGRYAVRASGSGYQSIMLEQLAAGRFQVVIL